MRNRHDRESTAVVSATSSSSSMVLVLPEDEQQRRRTDDADVAAGSTATTTSTTPTGNGGSPPRKSYKQQQHNGSPNHHHQNQNNKKKKMSSDRSRSSSAASMISIESAPSSAATINTQGGHPTDLEFFEDLVSEPVLVLGVDISHMDRKQQFFVCAVGVFGFSLLYGYLQELISVELADRQLGLFLAMMQFTGYTVLAYIMRNFVYEKQLRQKLQRQAQQQQQQQQHAATYLLPMAGPEEQQNASSSTTTSVDVPLMLYLGLSLLRAVDLAMTNLAMQYINYPAKTLMKSSRVVFTMFFGAIIARKRYHFVDYIIVLCMVAGLALFMHADANSAAVFHHTGVIMLTISLICDGAISNMSESIMKKFGVGQDEFIFRMYSIALVAIVVAAAAKGDLQEGLVWLSQPGTYDQVKLNVPLDQRIWSVPAKLICITIFSSMGFFGSSCSAAITKNFGALSMSITSTARKATTLFLSFFLFENICTAEHLAGIVMFIAALTAKSLRRGRASSSSGGERRRSRALKQKQSSISSTAAKADEQQRPLLSDGSSLDLEMTASFDSSLREIAIRNGSGTINEDSSSSKNHPAPNSANSTGSLGLSLSRNNSESTTRVATGGHSTARVGKSVSSTSSFMGGLVRRTPSSSLQTMQMGGNSGFGASATSTGPSSSNSGTVPHVI